MQRTLVYIVLVAFLAGNCLWASGDDKDKGKKKKKTEQVVTTFEPDPIPTGAKADRILQVQILTNQLFSVVSGHEETIRLVCKALM